MSFLWRTRVVKIRLLVPHNQAYRMLGLSRAVFDREVRPQLREARVGRRVLYSLEELRSVAENLLSGDNGSAASGSLDGNGETASCKGRKGKSQDFAIGTASGTFLRQSVSQEEAQLRFKKALAAVTFARRKEF